ncbi:MAG: ornithine carbamoyltransferase [Deltaproteobacteria bacterium]|nr:ornithine carbamoyltransferase [Deltaproteobacteria bacterium]
MTMRHLRNTLDVGDKKTLEGLLLRAQELKRHRAARRLAPTLSGRVIGMLFEKPSTRTRVSFEAGVKLLGGSTIVLQGRDLWLGASSSSAEPEVLRDTARVLGSSLDLLVVRPLGPHATIEELARHAAVPVVNGMSDTDHPCQVLTDLFTIYERREHPYESKVAFVGDSVAIAQGYLALAILTGLEVRLAMPAGVDVDADLLKRAQAKAKVSLHRSAAQAVDGADVVSTAAWSRPVASGFCVDDALLQKASPDATVLHSLPAHRGQEITDDVLEGTRSVCFQQAQNRLPVQQALLEHLLA